MANLTRCFENDTVNAYELQIASLFFRIESIWKFAHIFYTIDYTLNLKVFQVNNHSTLYTMGKLFATKSGASCWYVFLSSFLSPIVIAVVHLFVCFVLFSLLFCFFGWCLWLLAVVCTLLFCAYKRKSTTFVFLEQSTQHFESVGYICYDIVFMCVCVLNALWLSLCGRNVYDINAKCATFMFSLSRCCARCHMSDTCVTFR